MVMTMEDSENPKSSIIEEEEFTETTIDDLCGDLDSLSF